MAIDKKTLMLPENLGTGFKNPIGPYMVTANKFEQKTLGATEMVLMTMALTAQDGSETLETGLTLGKPEDWGIGDEGQSVESLKEGNRIWALSGVGTFISSAAEAAKTAGETVDGEIRDMFAELPDNASALVGWGVVFGETVTKNTKAPVPGGKAPKDYKNVVVLGIYATPSGELGEEGAAPAAAGEEGEFDSEGALTALIVSILEMEPAGLTPIKLAAKTRAEFTNDHGEEWGVWAGEMTTSDEYYGTDDKPWKLISGKLVIPKKAAAPGKPASKATPAPPGKPAAPGKKK